MKHNRFNTFFRTLSLQTAAPSFDNAMPRAHAQNNARVFMSSNDPDRTVKAHRRRPPGDTSGERERADTPQRETGGGGGGGGGGGYRPSGGGGLSGIPGGQNPIVLIAGLALIICVLVILSATGLLNDSGEQTTNTANEPTTVAQSGPTAVPPTRAPTRVPATRVPGAKDEKWLIMLYEDADDKVLEQDIYFDVNEAERIGSTNNVQIVAQVDRFKGAFLGDGNWTGARRYVLSPDEDLRKLKSEMVEDLGEVNMADSKTLVDFATWAIKNYPADKYVLILSDHGMGWPGGWTDGDNKAASKNRAPLAQAIGGAIFLDELDDALGKIRAQTGIDKFELVGMDACLMSDLAVYAALEPHARFAVASQETEPAVGWAYASFLQALNNNPTMDGGELGRAIVSSYITDDQRIVDDESRAEMMKGGRAWGGIPSAKQVAQEMSSSVTLTAVDLSKIPNLIRAVDQFAFALQSADQKNVASARRYAQNYTSIFGDDVPPSYLDLAHFAALVKQNVKDAKIAQAADAVVAATGETVLSEKHGPDKKGSHGISIYFPNSTLFKTPAAGPASYTAIGKRFAQESAWDDFLAFHYTGRTFDVDTQTSVVPDRSARVQAPGAGKITLSPLKLSDTVAAPGKPITLSSKVNGDNIGYIYIFAGYFDEQANSINVTDIDYLDSGTTRQVDGVPYPDWGQGAFNLEFDWEPIAFALNDGKTTATVLLNPGEYGADPATAVYVVDGIYTYKDSGATIPAKLHLSNGILTSVYGFSGEGGASAPREIVPTIGDTFTINEHWMDLDADGNVKQMATEQGKTLTFGEKPFTWKIQDAAAGEYRVGFIVTDLDGNRNQVFDAVTVQ